MGLLDFARKRLQAVLEEISRVAEYEFPYKGSKLALKKLEQLYRSRYTALAQLTPQSNPGVVKHTCSLALGELFCYLPLLGFVVRSTNVRNAFEVFRPLLRMARAVLEPGLAESQCQTQLVLSSEWDYSPFIYRDVPGLPGFVMIGLPSPESANPLLIPLAGHELGHSVWIMNGRVIENAIAPLVRNQTILAIQLKWKDFTRHFPTLGVSPAQLATNLVAIETWVNAAAWGEQQAEETFCDCLGLRLFGSSYLEAFAYLLAPSVPGERSLIYPNTLDRVDYLIRAAAAYNVPVPIAYRDQFEDNSNPPMTQPDEFLLSIADTAVSNVVDQIVQQANQVIIASGLISPNDAELNRILARFNLAVPAEKCKGLPDILNAAWRAFLDDSFWSDNPQISSKKDEVLKELVLKNIEIFEIEQIVG